MASYNNTTIASLPYNLTTGYTVGTISGATVNWPAQPTKFTSSKNTTIMSIPHGEDKLVLEETATLEVKGTVKINGVDLEERLNTIEKVLQIPTRDVTMEDKHPRLKSLYQEYMHELEKYKTWDRLNGDKNGTT